MDKANPHPQKLVDVFLDERRGTNAKATVQNNTYRLRNFLDWLNENDRNTIRDFDAFDWTEYKIWRQQQVKNTTLENTMRTVRMFLVWCANRELIDANEQIRHLDVPVADDEEKVRHTYLEDEAIEGVLDYLNKYEYASLQHTMFSVFVTTGMRVGSLRSLDLEDYHPETQRELAYLELHHRPESDTPLKNKKAAERTINLAAWVAEILDDYIDGRRVDSTDEHGRTPLFTSDTGKRVYQTMMTQNINYITRPCMYGECPDGRNPVDCDVSGYMEAARCPHTVSPHPLRRGYATRLKKDPNWSESAISKRLNMSPKTLNKHYNEVTEEEDRKMRARNFSEEDMASY